jgi:hypothetical protein
MDLIQASMEASQQWTTVFRNAVDGSRQLVHGCDHGDPHGSQCRCDRELCTCCAMAAAIWEESAASPAARQSRWQRSPAQVALECWFSAPSDAIRLAAPVLRTPSRRGQTWQGAVIAAMRRLLAAVWSAATRRRPFVPPLVPIRATGSAILDAPGGI